MTHEPAGAFQHARGIGDLGATKEPDIDMRLEDVDVGKCCVTYTGRWMAIVQQLSCTWVLAVADDREPTLRDCPQFTGMLMHPDVDTEISPDRSGESAGVGSFSVSVQRLRARGFCADSL